MKHGNPSPECVTLPASRADLLSLVRNMRESDWHEMALCAMATGARADRAYLAARLHDAYMPRWWAMWHRDGLLGLCGVTKMPQPGAGAIWFLGTPLADRKPKALTRACRSFVAMSRKEWAWLGNVVPASCVSRLQWLEKLGFDTRSQEANVLARGLVAFSLQSRDGPENRPAAPARG